MWEEEPLSSCGFVRNVVRAAQMLGLNRESSYFPTLIDPVTEEVHRRVGVACVPSRCTGIKCVGTVAFDRLQLT